MFAQQLLNGVVVGAVYALFSLGLTLIFGIHRILNLAHGAIFMWGALIGLFVVAEADLPLPVAMLIAMLGGGGISVLLDLVAFRPLRKRNGDEMSMILASIGANLILVDLAQRATNSQPMSFPFGTFPVHIYRLLGLTLSLQQIAIVVAVVLMVAGLIFYLFKTGLGSEVRAVAVNERMAMLLGINPARVYFQTFFISGALGAAAGVILSLAFNTVNYSMGTPMLLQAFVVIVLGGLGSVIGAVYAGIFLGMVQTLTTVYVSSELSDAILFGLLFLILMVRPAGLFPGLQLDRRKV